MEFEAALHIIKGGGRVCRVGEEAGHAFIYLHYPQDAEPYIALRGTAEVGSPLFPYNFSTADVLSDKWYEVATEDGMTPIALDSTARRTKEMAHATEKALHWEMMADTEQANAWCNYYREIYALASAPEWPLVTQWPTLPET